MHTGTRLADDIVRIHSLRLTRCDSGIRALLFFEIEFEWACAQQTNPIHSAALVVLEATARLGASAIEK